ncbi:hypothetical protein U1Q18_045547 [Sarracenia purpurea var. burkii]
MGEEVGEGEDEFSAELGEEVGEWEDEFAAELGKEPSEGTWEEEREFDKFIGLNGQMIELGAKTGVGSNALDWMD